MDVNEFNCLDPETSKKQLKFLSSSQGIDGVAL